jgi:hypothetical protein
LVVSVLAGTKAMVWPSGLARATAAVPIEPLAPGRLSTSTVTPSDSAIFAPTSRAK